MRNQAEEAVSKGDWPTALKLAQEALRHNPQDWEALFVVGLAHAAQGSYAAAEDPLRRLLAEVPQHVDALYTLANIRIEQRDFLSAEDLLRRAVTLKSRHHAAWARLGYALETMGRRREAIPAYRCALETSPNPGGRFDYKGLDFTTEVIEALERLSQK